MTFLGSEFKKKKTHLSVQQYIQYVPRFFSTVFGSVQF